MEQARACYILGTMSARGTHHLLSERSMEPPCPNELPPNTKQTKCAHGLLSAATAVSVKKASKKRGP